MKHIELFESSLWGRHSLTSKCPHCEGTGRINSKEIEKNIKKLLSDTDAPKSKYEDIADALLSSDDSYIDGVKDFLLKTGIFSDGLFNLVAPLKFNASEIKSLIKKTEEIITSMEESIEHIEKNGGSGYGNSLEKMKSVAVDGKRNLAKLKKMV